MPQQDALGVVGALTITHSINSPMVGLTGQSLPTLEDLYFACVDDACSLSHFLPRSTSSNQLGIKCDIVITPRNASLVKTIRLCARDAVGSRCTVNVTTGLGANVC
jgi:hypothetical protein